jgi:AcrR family transcriptional regulator
MAAATKERILVTAERLSAGRGFAATSLREVALHAGVNLAATNYHFGSKEALLVAVWDRHWGPINEERLALLDELERSAGMDGPVLEDILTACLGPVFQKGLDWVTEVPESVRQRANGPFEEVWTRFVTAFRRALPHLQPDEVSERMSCVIGAALFNLSSEWSEPTTHIASDPEQRLRRVVGFAAGGLAAPASERHSRRHIEVSSAAGSQ